MRIRLSDSVQYDTSTILDGFLFLGAKGVTSDLETLCDLGVTFILNITEVEPNPKQFPDNFRILSIPVKDSSDVRIAEHFDKCVAFIEEGRKAKAGVLVHGNMGMSRSATVVLAYLMLQQDMTLKQAIEHVKERRPVISPNVGFMEQLVDLEREIKGEATVDLVKYAATRFGPAESFESCSE